MSSLPYRQLRNRRGAVKPLRTRSLPYRQIKCEKKLVLSYELFFKYGGEGGIDSLRSPCGQPAHCVHGLSNWLSPVVEPRSGLLIPPGVCNIRKKSPYFRTSFFLNMAVRGGFEPPIRCRIHTFQACSFSHSDTSPNCRSCLAGTGANL